MTPVLCLPGLQGSKEVFEPLVAALRGQAEVTPMDLPPGRPHEAASVLASQLRQMDGGPWHLVGGSYGGLVGLHLGAEHVRSLALVGTCPVAGAVPIGFRVLSAVARFLPGPIRSVAYRRRLRGVLRDDGVSADIVQRVVSHAPTASVLNDRLMGAGDERPVPLREIPLMWIRGDHDEQISWEDALVVDHWPSVKVIRVPGGHRPYASHARALALALSDFWEGIDSK